MKIISSFSGEYAFLSNFFISPITHGRLKYMTVEHAFQASKTKDRVLRKRVAQISTPGKAKRYGRKLPLREDWEQVKIGVMRSLLRKKFRIPALRRLLLETGDAVLIEGNHWHDTFWGVCQGQGENHLGKLLMEVRDEIRSGK